MDGAVSREAVESRLLFLCFLPLRIIAFRWIVIESIVIIAYVTIRIYIKSEIGKEEEESFDIPVTSRAAEKKIECDKEEDGGKNLIFFFLCRARAKKKKGEGEMGGWQS